MINTFKFKAGLHKGRFPKKCQDWFGLHFYVCNVIHFSLTFIGYGFWFETMIYDVMKNNNTPEVKQ